MKSLLAGTIVTFATVSAMACPSGTKPTDKVWQGNKVCEVEGRYITDLVLTNDYSYHLKGGVFIGNDNKHNSSITIEPGTTIAGASGADFLVITRGSKIIAEGNANQPITFTTHAVEPKRGSWGGLVINGNAPINCVNPVDGICEAEGEGSTGLYGGSNAMDNSGLLKYVKVEYAGYEITPENELNGIAFQGVGAGTLVDYIQVHMNADDGVEFFGGTVNVKHVLLTGNKDDSMDWTSGWTGKAQFVLIQQAADEGNNGIEADNLVSPMNASPRSNPTIANLTMFGSMTASKGASGLLLRKGTGLKLYNSAIKGFKVSGIDVDDAETFRNGHAYTEGLSGIHITNTVFDNQLNFLTDAGEESLASWMLDKMDLDIMFGAAKNEVLNLERAGNSIKVNMDVVSVDDSFFEEVDYIGAVDPKGEDWTAGWVTQL
jgi:hypothetical protein